MNTNIGKHSVARLAIAFIAITLTLALGYLSGTSNLIDHSIGAVVEGGCHG